MAEDRSQHADPEPAEFGSPPRVTPPSRKASMSASLAARLRAEKGMGRELVKVLKVEHRNNPVQQFNLFWDRIGLKPLTGVERKSAGKTQRAYQKRSLLFLGLLREQNIRLDSIDQIRQKHALAVLRAMERKAHKPSTILGVWTTLRRFLNFLGRADQMPAPPDCLENPEATKRSLANVVDKSFTGNNVVAEVAIAECRARFHEIPAWRLDFMHEFGARVEEAGHVSASSFREDYVHLHDGTKGGLERDVPIQTEGQRRVVAEFFALLKKYPSRDEKLYEPGKRRTWESVRNRMNYVARKLGLTKKALGVTQHSLRHEYAQKRLQQATGKLPPVRGGQLSYVEDRAGFTKVTNELGHGRLNVVSAYAGSTTVQQRHEAAVAKQIHAKFQTPEFTRAFLACGVQRVVLVGASARQLYVRDLALLAWDGDASTQEAPELLQMLKVVFPNDVLFVDISVENKEASHLEVFDRDAALRENA